MKLLVDVNVVLDVLLARDPWAAEAAALLTAIERGRAEGYLAGHTVTTVHCIVSRNRDRRSAARAVTDLLRIFEIVPVDKADLAQALVLPVRDFEDAVQAACALRMGADAIVTRNETDFKGAGVAASRAGALLARL